MAVHRCMKKSTANHRASEAREDGYNASVYKAAKGYHVSVTRK